MRSGPKIAGIICEYNPFHNGHAFQIEKVKESADFVVAVMSGNFTQRGEPAIVEKHIRTKMALLGGADLVIELPAVYAISTAQRFAMGGVGLLNAMGCVDCISFGSESGETGELKALASLLQKEDLYEAIRARMKDGVPFAKARQDCVAAISPALASHLGNPNDILGVEYLLAMEKYHAPMEVLTVTRQGARHNGTPREGIASASWLRERILEKDRDILAGYMPEYSLVLLEQEWERGAMPRTAALGERMILGVLRRLSMEELEALPDVSEGIHRRIYEAIHRETSLDGILKAVQTKRYPAARIRRILMAGCLGIPKELSLKAPPYLRVLGLNKNGAEILRQCQKTATVPVAHSFARLMGLGGDCRAFCQVEERSTELYGLMAPVIQPGRGEYTLPVVTVKEQS